ncbi:unnamed protein product [Cuscuta campestris]|uniref:Uncharacterized protein n=1 Tax=Cuscuta campestris TaxID=132261 RepID=A0A484NPI6_9ASTE|nr:unnamed protein product [Cuscuta campestris]
MAMPIEAGSGVAEHIRQHRLLPWLVHPPARQSERFRHSHPPMFLPDEQDQIPSNHIRIDTIGSNQFAPDSIRSN